MAVRTSMTEIISFLRVMVGDTAAPQEFSDQNIQDICDQDRSWWRIVPLDAVHSIAPGGILTFKDFYASTGTFENDVILQDNVWNTVTPATSDLSEGHWTFTVQPLWPIYLTGKLYDMNAIAADICEMWAARFVKKHDNESGQFKNTRGQWHNHMVRQARMFRQQAKTTSATIVRDDIAIGGY